MCLKYNYIKNWTYIVNCRVCTDVKNRIICKIKENLIKKVEYEEIKEDFELLIEQIEWHIEGDNDEVFRIQKLAEQDKLFRGYIVKDLLRYPALTEK